MSYHSSPLNGDTGLKELESYIGATSLNLMDEWGYDMEKYTMFYTEFWVLEFSKNGGGHCTLTFHILGGASRTVFHGDFWAFVDTYYIMTQSLGAYESNSVTIDAIRIKATSGDVASGIFKLYGVI